MVGPSEVDESKRYYTADQIGEALSEAREECYREPETDLWKSFWDRLAQGRFIPPDPIVPMEEKTRENQKTKTVFARDLKQHDVLVFAHGTQLTVRYCEPSVVDPVYLIGFKENKNQIAKAPLDEVRILDKGE